MQVKKQQSEPDKEQWSGSKLQKEYVKAVYCFPAYLTLMQSTLCEMLGWIESQAATKIAGRNINNLRYVDYITLMAEKKEKLRSLLMRVKEESEKAGLKLNIQSGSPFFVYFAFLCLQVSSVSNFCPDTSGQRLTCSTAVERNGHCKQIPLACVGSAFSGWMDHTGFATAHGDVYFPGPHCSASRVLCKGTVPGEPCILSTSQV